VECEKQDVEKYLERERSVGWIWGGGVRRWRWMGSECVEGEERRGGKCEAYVGVLGEVRETRGEWGERRGGREMGEQTGGWAGVKGGGGAGGKESRKGEEGGK